MVLLEERLVRRKFGAVDIGAAVGAEGKEGVQAGTGADPPGEPVPSRGRVRDRARDRRSRAGVSRGRVRERARGCWVKAPWMWYTSVLGRFRGRRERADRVLTA